MDTKIVQELVELTLTRRKIARVTDCVSRIFTTETVDCSWDDLERMVEQLEAKLDGMVVMYSNSSKCYILVPRVFCI